jgi:hypothetical protein
LVLLAGARSGGTEFALLQFELDASEIIARIVTG